MVMVILCGREMLMSGREKHRKDVSLSYAFLSSPLRSLQENRLRRVNYINVVIEFAIVHGRIRCEGQCSG